MALTQQQYEAVMHAYPAASEVAETSTAKPWTVPAPGSALAQTGVGGTFMDWYEGICFVKIAPPPPPPEPEPEPEPETLEDAVRRLYTGVTEVRVVSEADDYQGEAWQDLPADAPAVLADVQAVSVDAYDGVITVLIGDATPPDLTQPQGMALVGDEGSETIIPAVEGTITPLDDAENAAAPVVA